MSEICDTLHYPLDNIFITYDLHIPSVTNCACLVADWFLFIHAWFFLFVFVALRPMSTAMVIAGRSVHLTTLFPGQA